MIWIALIVIGEVIRIWAVGTLGGRWHNTLRVPEKLVRRGAYRYIRHPAYVGAFISLVGISGLSVRAAFIWLAFSFYYARVCEEEYLMEYHPDCRKYKARTNRFLPTFKTSRHRSEKGKV